MDPVEIFWFYLNDGVRTFKYRMESTTKFSKILKHYQRCSGVDVSRIVLYLDRSNGIGRRDLDEYPMFGWHTPRMLELEPQCVVGLVKTPFVHICPQNEEVQDDFIDIQVLVKQQGRVIGYTYAMPKNAAFRDLFEFFALKTRAYDHQHCFMYVREGEATDVETDDRTLKTDVDSEDTPESLGIMPQNGDFLYAFLGLNITFCYLTTGQETKVMGKWDDPMEVIGSKALHKFTVPRLPHGIEHDFHMFTSDGHAIGLLETPTGLELRNHDRLLLYDGSAGVRYVFPNGHFIPPINSVTCDASLISCDDEVSMIKSDCESSTCTESHGYNGNPSDEMSIVDYDYNHNTRSQSNQNQN